MNRVQEKGASAAGLHWMQILFLLAVIGNYVTEAIQAEDDAIVEFSIFEGMTEVRVPCRVHLRNREGRSVRPKNLKSQSLPWFHDHFCCPGTASLQIPAGDYHYEIERGPEYAVVIGDFSVRSGERLNVRSELNRLIDMKQEGWWSGETHVHRPLRDVPLLMQAEDLQLAVVITWWNENNLWDQQPLPSPPVMITNEGRVIDQMGGEDERGGGALLFSGLQSPLPIQKARRESPASNSFLRAGKKLSAWVDAEKPFWWDFPVWLSTGMVDSVGIANNHMCRSEMYPGKEAWGHPRDLNEFPEPLGNGYWTQSIYYHALNAGFRIPPSAGSASGVLPNPVGYNRMYVRADGELTLEKWWSAVRSGQVFVTNGPLLRVTANAQHPGHVFQSEGPVELTIDGRIDSRDAIRSLELVHDGRIQRLERFPTTLELSDSGWFLIRAVADVDSTFRFASTGPWYVEIAKPGQSVQKNSCDFFRRWTGERIDCLRQTLISSEDREMVLPEFEAAQEFWEKRAGAAMPVDRQHTD